MNPNSISGSSNNYLQLMLGNQMTGKSSQPSSSQSADKGQLSAFAQLFSDSSTSSTSSSAGSSANPDQLLSQLVSSFQTSSIQNRSASIDPLSIGQ